MDVLNNEIWESFFESNKAVNIPVTLDADRLGGTTVQLKALYNLASNQNIGVGELAEKLRLTKSTASNVIERLVQIGLVECVIPSENNRRAVSIHLTEKGKMKFDHFYSSDSIIIKKINDVLELTGGGNL